MKNVKVILGVCIGILLGGLIGIKASELIGSDQVIYKENKTVEDTLDELYELNSSNQNIKYNDETNELMVFNSTLGQYVPVAKLPSIPLNNVYLYNNGDRCDWLTGGWTSSESSWKADSQISFYGVNIGDNAVAVDGGKTTNTIDLTNYNELHIKYYDTGSGNHTWLRLCVDNTSGTCVKFGDFSSTSTTGVQEFVLDITELSGQFRIRPVGMLYGYGDQATFHITEIWLS